MKRIASQTTNAWLRVGQWFAKEGRMYEIASWEATDMLRIHAYAFPDRSMVEFALVELLVATPPVCFAPTQTELQRLLAANTGAQQQTLASDAMPDKLLQRADRILAAICAVNRHAVHLAGGQQAPQVVPVDELRRICATLSPPIALSTYYKYRQICEENGGSRAKIAAALHRSTYGKTKMSADQQYFVDAIVRTFYRSDPPMRLQTVYTIAEQIWLHTEGRWVDTTIGDKTTQDAVARQLMDVREPIQSLLNNTERRACLRAMRLPSRSWFYGYVKQQASLPADVSESLGTGIERRAQEHDRVVFDDFVHVAAAPLQFVVADHYKLDVLHVDNVRREPVGRLWLTVLIDAYSRAILGLYLGYEDPCIESIQGALLNAIWPKRDLDRFDLKQNWSTFGIPQRLSLDNAWAHHSASLEDLIGALNNSGTRMELVFRPPYKARYGGLVERLFGNIAGQIREMLPGALLKAEERHLHDANKKACLLFDDVERIVHQIVCAYMHSPHRELGMQSPHDRWMAGLELGVRLPPPLTPTLMRMFWRAHQQTRFVTHEGIGLFGMHYWSPELGLLRQLDGRGQKRSFRLRYWPSDISRVAVFENGQWLGDAFARELRLPDGKYEPTSLWELELMKEAGAPSGEVRRAKPRTWLADIMDTRDLIEQRRAEQKTIRRKFQQIDVNRARRKPKRDTASSLTDSANEHLHTAGERRRRDTREHTLKQLKEML